MTQRNTIFYVRTLSHIRIARSSAPVVIMFMELVTTHFSIQLGRSQITNDRPRQRNNFQTDKCNFYIVKIILRVSFYTSPLEKKNSGKNRDSPCCKIQYFRDTHTQHKRHYHTGYITTSYYASDIITKRINAITHSHNS